MLNEAVGWLAIHLGIISGMLLGLGFLRPEFLGGYGSERRRLLRLGHISFFGLGVLNLMLAHSSAMDVETGAQGVLRTIASVGMAVAACTMPLACAAVAWKRSWSPVFAIPVIAALTSTSVVCWEVAT